MSPHRPRTPSAPELLLTGCLDHRQLSSPCSECWGHPMTGKLRNGGKRDKFGTASILGRTPAVMCWVCTDPPHTNSRLTQGSESCHGTEGRCQGMVEHWQHPGVSDMSDSHPQQPCAQGSSQRQDILQGKGTSCYNPRILLPAPSTGWGSLPGVLPILVQGSTFMDVDVLKQ